MCVVAGVYCPEPMRFESSSNEDARKGATPVAHSYMTTPSEY